MATKKDTQAEALAAMLGALRSALPVISSYGDMSQAERIQAAIAEGEAALREVCKAQVMAEMAELRNAA